MSEDYDLIVIRAGMAGVAAANNFVPLNEPRPAPHQGPVWVRNG